ncbi:hypothetical protein GXM_05921 [Nostoc sphaeroides CCNUC1]|uniref:Uncharacterized protein n=1 Tax=Nostoc sphaeroides CCNUC1 TaxID=2653204 RepID=A0A5P8W6P2_9NOSO|nr:hypothetical protein GXM_05921 [Nostoc sphaeroides CCNUC1]
MQIVGKRCVDFLQIDTPGAIAKPITPKTSYVPPALCPLPYSPAALRLV